MMEILDNKVSDSVLHFGRTFFQWTALLILISTEATVVIRPLLHNETIVRIEDAEAAFGPSLHLAPVAGRVFPSSPLNGCVDSIPLPENASEYALPFISLIVRGSCSFANKVIAAQKGNYSAAIIYNDEDDSFFTMGGNGSFLVQIPSVMIGLSDGLLIKQSFCHPKQFVAEIKPNSDRNLLYYLIPVFVVFSLLIIGLSGIYVARCWCNYRRQQRRCLTKSHLIKIPQLNYVKGETPYETCAICLEDYDEGAKLRILPCKHAYHSKCIDPWLLKRRRVCPICKRRIRRFGTSSRNPHSDVNAESALLTETDSDVDSELDEAVESSNEHQVTNRPTSSGIPPSYGTVTNTPRLPTGQQSDANEHTPLLSSDTSIRAVPALNEPTWPTSGPHSEPPDLTLQTDNCSVEDGQTVGAVNPAWEADEVAAKVNSAFKEGCVSGSSSPSTDLTPFVAAPSVETQVTVIVHRSSEDDNESDVQV